jgi:D-3-phosphoglycerate dehydrogenase
LALLDDYYFQEPSKNGLGFDSPLRGLDNVIMTPHIGGSTMEAQANIAEEVAEKMIRLVKNGSTTTNVGFICFRFFFSNLYVY